MKNLILSLTSALDTVRIAAEDIRKQLYTEANERKENLRRAIADMEEASDIMSEFSDHMFALSGECEEIADDMSISAEHIDEMISDMNVYVASVEAFEGYCDKCGSEMLASDDVFVDDDNLCVCVNCYNRNEVVETETQPTTPVQRTIEELVEEEA